MTDDRCSAVPIALPFDDEGDAPVPFALTAAGHRALGPTGIPALRLVADPEPDPAPAPAPADDLRPAQARALRRSGMRVATIAAALDVDADVVATWTADLPQRVGARPSPRLRAPGGPPARERTVRGRETAAAAGLAVALARVDADGTAVTLTDARPDVLAAALDAIRGEVRIPAGVVRVAARVGPRVAADRFRAELAHGFGLPDERIVVGRWDGAGDPAAVEIRIRISEPRAVRAVDAWATAITADRSTSVAAAAAAT